MAFSGNYGADYAEWATREYFAPKVQDLVLNSNATLHVLRQNMKIVNGGLHIDGFGMYKESTQGEWIGKSDTYTHAVEQKFDSARWNWKIRTEPVALLIQDMLENQGSDTSRFNLVMNENIAAAKSLSDHVGRALYSLNIDNMELTHPESIPWGVNDETGTGDETDTDTSLATYATVTRTASGDTATFNANVDDSTAIFSVGAANDLWLDCTEGPIHPTLWTANNKATGFYYDEMTPIQRQETDDLMGKMGFTAYFLNGAPWVVDSHVPSSDRSVPASPYGTAPTAAEYVYALHTPVVQLTALKGAAFEFMGEMMPIDQWSVVGRYFASYNVPVLNPRFCGVMSALTS